MNRFSRKLPVSISFVFVLLTLTACLTGSPQTTQFVGQIEDFSSGSVTSIELPGTFIDPDPPAMGSETPGVVTQPASAEVSPIPVFIVSSDDGGLIALYSRDPFRGCRIQWMENQNNFQDPCHGSSYTPEGEWIMGPSPRDMDRFAIHTNDDMQVFVDITDFHMGEPH